MGSWIKPTGSAVWGAVTGDIDNQADLQDEFATKQDVIVAGTGLELSENTLNHSNSIAAQATEALRSLAYDAQGHITSSTAKSLGRGISESSNEIGHSNSVTAQTTTKLGQIKYDAQGHITGFIEKAVVDNLTSTATDQPLSAAQGKALNDKITGISETTITLSSEWSGSVKCYKYGRLAILTFDNLVKPSDVTGWQWFATGAYSPLLPWCSGTIVSKSSLKPALVSVVGGSLVDVAMIVAGEQYNGSVVYVTAS